MSYSVHTAVNPLSEIHLARSSVPKPEYLLNFFWGEEFEGKEELASIYCLYRCSKNWYLVGSVVSEEEADERRVRMHEKVSGGKKETNERSQKLEKVDMSRARSAKNL